MVLLPAPVLLPVDLCGLVADVLLGGGKCCTVSVEFLEELIALGTRFGEIRLQRNANLAGRSLDMRQSCLEVGWERNLLRCGGTLTVFPSLPDDSRTAEELVRAKPLSKTVLGAWRGVVSRQERKTRFKGLECL